MKALFITAGFFGAWWLADNIPAALVTPISIVALVAIFTATAVALSKWVKNV